MRGIRYLLYVVCTVSGQDRDAASDMSFEEGEIICVPLRRCIQSRQT